MHVPRLGTARNIGFLIDTGADTSLLNPSDARFAPTFQGFGLGGSTLEWHEEVVLTLTHVGGEVDRFQFVLPFAMESDENFNFPSLVGMDLLQRYRLTVDLQADIVTLQ